MKKIKGEAGALTIASNAVKRLFMKSISGKDQLRCDHDHDVTVCSTCFMKNVITWYSTEMQRKIISRQWKCERSILLAWETLFRDRELWLMRHGSDSDGISKAMSFIDTTFK